MPDTAHYASIQNPRMYRALRRQGLSKESAARIANARTPGHTVKAHGPRDERAWRAREDWLDGIAPALKRAPSGGRHYVRDANGRFARTAGSAARSDARASLVGAHAEQRAGLRAQHAQERHALRAQHAQERVGGATTAAQRAEARAALQRQHAGQRAALRETHAGQRASLSAQHAAERLGEQADLIAQARKKVPKDPAESLAYGTDPNTSYTMRHRLVDMADIQASNTQSGAINPSYDPALQPRDRSRQASQSQIDAVARKLNPDALVTDFHQIDKGTPIIDRDGNVLSGNGRTLALQRAAEQHPEVYAAYKEKLRERAAELGLDPAEVGRMKNPVLVRELTGDHDTAAFAREANSSGTLRMSPMEQAKVDAGLISDRQMLGFKVKDDQNIDQALRDRENRPWVNRFLADVPDNERANLLTRDGDLNQMGLYRAKAAIYTRAFPGEAGERMAESMLESLDPNLKSIQTGISGALPSLARVRAQTGSGERDADLDLTGDIAKAVDVLARVRDNPALTANTPTHKVVEKYLSQSQLFDRELSADQERMLVHLDQISRKPTAVRDFMTRYADLVDAQPPPGQGGLFGDDARMTRAQLITALLGDGGGGARDSQESLF